MLNPEYDLTVLEAADVAALLGDSGLPWRSMTPQTLSDVVRAKLLAQRGGIWVDASVLAVSPVDVWLAEAMSQTSFFAFERPAPDRPISTWFLAASQGHYLILKWWEQIGRFWDAERTLMEYEGKVIPPDAFATVSPATQTIGKHPYFWFHYLFQYLIETDKEFNRQWMTTRRYPAGPAHGLQELFASAAKPKQSQIQAGLNAAPVQKLNWRTEYPIRQFDKLLSPPAGLWEFP
jgi:hypothetical protein